MIILQYIFIYLIVGLALSLIIINSEGAKEEILKEPDNVSPELFTLIVTILWPLFTVLAIWDIWRGK